MAEFLWELDIEKLPLGWNSIYEDACENFQNGIEFEKHFIHPIECRIQLLTYFNTYKEKAKSTYERLLKEFDSEVLHSLLKYDQILYSTLYEWLHDSRDHSEFDPKDIPSQVNDHYGYVLSPKGDMSFIEPYKKLQFIKMDFDSI